MALVPIKNLQVYGIGDTGVLPTLQCHHLLSTFELALSLYHNLNDRHNDNGDGDVDDDEDDDDDDHHHQRTSSINLTPSFSSCSTQ